MAYLPKSKYQRKYTNGGEFIVARTGLPYIGDYLELSNKTYFAGSFPQTITEPLKPINIQSSNIVDNIANRKFQILNPTYVKKEAKYVEPIATKVAPKEIDYNRGRYIRYFLYRIVKQDYIEVDRKTYEETIAGDIIDRSLYLPGSLKWTLKGNAEQFNAEQLIIIEQIFPGVSALYPNLVEFVTRNQAKFLTNPSTVSNFLTSNTDNQEKNLNDENIENEGIDEEIDAYEESNEDDSDGSPSGGSGGIAMFTNYDASATKGPKSPDNPFEKKKGY